MTVAQARRGTARDGKVRDLLAADDWFAICSRGSHGAADVLAIKVGCRPRVIQVKSTKSPYHSFGPAERAELSFAARLGGADAFLVWWPVHARKPVWIAEGDWPR